MADLSRQQSEDNLGRVLVCSANILVPHNAGVACAILYSARWMVNVEHGDRRTVSLRHLRYVQLGLLR